MSPVVLHASWSFLAHVADPAARALVLGCFAVLALAALRVETVRVTLLVWRGVLIASLAMPLVVLVAPPVRVLVPVPSLGVPAASVPSQANKSAQPALLSETSTRAILADAATSHRSAINPSSVGAQSPAPVRRSRQYPWPLLLLATYFGVAVFLLARLLVGLRLGQRLQRSGQPIGDSVGLRTLNACANGAGIVAPPLLAECETLAVPLTLGVRNAVILLPADWREWQADELEAVLAHEVSHIARADVLFQRLALIHRAIFWFSPLAWWIERRLADLAEQASDEAALAGGADRRRYAETLLGFFAALEASPERVWWQGLSMANPGQAEKRVDRILEWRGAMPNKMKKSLVLAFLAAALPVAALTATLHTEMYTDYDQEPAPPQGPPAPVAPNPSAHPVINPGPAPAAPNVTPAAPGAEPAAPAVSPVAPTPRPEAAPLPEPPQGADIEALRESRELGRVQEALNRTEEALSAAKLQAASSATKQHMKDLRAAEAAYQDTVSKYEADFDHLQQLAKEQQEARSARHRIYGSYESGPRFVIVSKDTDSVTMSGSEEDAEHARALRSKIPGDFIWFERDEKSYIIRDQATVDRAKTLWKPQEELGKKQEELGKQQEALGKQQEELGEKMEQVRVKIPDMTAQLQKLAAEMKQLSASGGTMEQIGELQSRIGDIQGDAGRQQGEIGRQQGELGRQQGELGRQQGELARQASRQMKQLLDDATARGLAQPETSQQ